MKEYVETIRLEQARFHLLPLHQQRMAATIREAYGDQLGVPSLEAALTSAIEIPDGAIYKCRVVYGTDIRKIEILPYSPRKVSSLRLVTAPSGLDYHLKTTDRTALSALAAEKGDYDEVIIVRDGLVTDTSYTNLLFKSAEGMLTPRTPLLAGTMRRRLLDEGLATPADITPSDLLPGNKLGITHAILINAMMPPASAPSIPISQILP